MFDKIETWTRWRHETNDWTIPEKNVCLFILFRLKISWNFFLQNR